MKLDHLGSTLFSHLVARFETLTDCGHRSMKELESDVAANPNDSTALNALGLRLLHDAKYELARVAFARSIRNNPGDETAGLGLACALEAQLRPQSALEELEHTLRCESSEPALCAQGYLGELLGAGHPIEFTQVYEYAAHL